MEPQLEAEKKDCSSHLDHSTKMAATPMGPINIFKNDDHGLSLTFLTERYFFTKTPIDKILKKFFRY